MSKMQDLLDGQNPALHTPTPLAEASLPLDVFVTILLSDREKNFDESLDKAIKATGVPQDIMERPEAKDLIHQRLSNGNPRVQLLKTKQIMLWNTNREALNEFTDEDKIKEVNLRDKISDLQDKLEGQISKLYTEIYGEFQDIAKEQMKKTLSPEQRLKAKKT